MSYPIETILAPRSVWYTPQEARDYYGRYDRSGVTIHWWGDGSGADNHDNIVNFFLQRTNGSVNYVVSDRKITMMVDPDNVAWCSQAGNPTTISIEHQPTLSDEGYKRSGWLIAQLEKRYGRELKLFKHSEWYGTACPGSLDVPRIQNEVIKAREEDVAEKADLVTGRILAETQHGYLNAGKGQNDDVVKRDFAGAELTNEFIQRLYHHQNAVAFRTYRDYAFAVANSPTISSDDPAIKEALTSLRAAEQVLTKALSS